jgi:hypothetical protein
MKLRLSLRNLAKQGLNLLIISCLLGGCSSSITPTYYKENLAGTIENICKDEYKVGVKVKLIGHTLWIYLPLEDLFIQDKPEKIVDRFLIEHNKSEFKGGSFNIEYLIRLIPEQDKYNTYKFDKSATEKINNVWKVLRRVLFSMGGSQPQFFCLVTADIKNGFEISQIFYYSDLKKVSYEFISLTEYQHRTIQDTLVSSDILGDTEGSHLKYKDFTLEEFILAQIEYRIKLKFGKPEVERNADIDKEILKIVVETLKIYSYKDFLDAQLNNLLGNKKIVLNEAAIWAKPIERKF